MKKGVFFPQTNDQGLRHLFLTMPGAFAPRLAHLTCPCLSVDTARMYEVIEGRSQPLKNLLSRGDCDEGVAV